ncbi:GNAT family N-acetyltransferase [Deinococcus sp. Leaf326]|uniref:GNAT family N-acetyltransferase n=1 Tax=Deinococcus sp. Leaf326 TaxID=1736338 RepID=UPI000AD00D5D|nr:GNAT family N-acetyltransferase [Deinococcus sp. Leaf326]
MATFSIPPPTLPIGLRLHSVTAADHRRLAAFLSVCHPEQPVTAEDLDRLAQGRMPGEVHAATLLLRGDALVGLAETGTPRMDGHPGWLEVTVRAADPALGAALLELAEAQARAHTPHTLVTRVHEDWWERGLYEAHAYAEHDRMWPSTLDLTTVDFGRFAAYEERTRAAGITVRPLSSLGAFDEAAQRRLYTLMAALLRDVPSATPVSVWPFETWQRRVVPHLHHPEGLFIAIAPDGQWVGLSELHTPYAAHPGTVRNGLTGVLGAWRGHGVAFSLKLAAARAARERGFTHARTGNHSANAPMLGINAALGFVREPATVTLIKTL